MNSLLRVWVESDMVVKKRDEDEDNRHDPGTELGAWRNNLNQAPVTDVTSATDRYGWPYYAHTALAILSSASDA